jgi:hypothetical protein
MKIVRLSELYRKRMAALQTEMAKQWQAGNPNAMKIAAKIDELASVVERLETLRCSA